MMIRIFKNSKKTILELNIYSMNKRVENFLINDKSIKSIAYYRKDGIYLNFGGIWRNISQEYIDNIDGRDNIIEGLENAIYECDEYKNKYVLKQVIEDLKNIK